MQSTLISSSITPLLSDLGLLSLLSRSSVTIPGKLEDIPRSLLELGVDTMLVGAREVVDVLSPINSMISDSWYRTTSVVLAVASSSSSDEMSAIVHVGISKSLLSHSVGSQYCDLLSVQGSRGQRNVIVFGVNMLLTGLKDFTPSR